MREISTSLDPTARNSIDFMPPSVQKAVRRAR